MINKIVLRKGKEESLERFHPWIFSGAIHHTEGDAALEEGDIVEVLASDGRFLALGHWQIGSIAVRVLTFKRQRIDVAFWKKRLAAALDVRRAIGVVGQEEIVNSKSSNSKCNDIYRLVHGEGDNLPGLIIDIYGATAVMQAHSVGMHVCRQQIAEALRETMGDSLRAIYYKSETTLPFKAQLGQENGFIWGESSDDVARENGLAFHIDWLKGQ
ncbi:MAG: class I SAM-dependent rRNA methyltransferase, partial [Bacteroidaceae bacterium]|nr:class I SAM-dependent rRNA methyltransferase [Bacteroidaceae bacterium]